MTDLKESSKLGKSVYIPLEFRTWGIKSMLSVPCEPAEACYPVNVPAGGCSFDGMNNLPYCLHLHPNVPGIFFASLSKSW
jgi:hypothetical protein